MGKRKRFVKRQMGVLLALLVLSNSMLVYADEPTTVTVAEDERYSEDTTSNVVVEEGGEITGGTHTVGEGETVTVEAGGTISGGTFEGEAAGGTGTGEVENSGTISGGDFTVPVKVEEGGTISDGTFYETVVNYGEIIGGIFKSIVENYGTITGGTFEATVNNKNGGNISSEVNDDGATSVTFTKTSTINNESGGTISEGTFKGAVYNNGTISGGTYRNTYDLSGNGDILNNGSASGATTGTITGGTFIGKEIKNYAGSTMSNVVISNGRVINTGEIEDSTLNNTVNIWLLEERNQDGEVVGAGSISGSTITDALINTKKGDYRLPYAYDTERAVIEDSSMTSVSLNWIKGITFDHVTINSLTNGSVNNLGRETVTSVTFNACTISDSELLAQLQELQQQENVVIIERPVETSGNSTGNPAGSIADSASGSTEAGTGGELSYHIESSSSNASAMEATSENSSSQTNPMELYRQKLFAPQTKLTKTVVFDNLYARGYSLALMRLIKEHNELSYTFKMKYQGHVYTITIPAGYEWDVDEDITWYGPLKLFEMFGGDVEEA